MIRINKAGIDLIKSFERFMPKPYHGAADREGLFTIGYGTIIYPNGKRVLETDPAITEQQATDFLMDHINKMLPTIDVYLRDDLSDNQFSALASFAYNVGEGWGGLRGSTLLEKVNAKPMDTDIRNEFMRWVHGAGGVVVEGLKRRRQAEADLYFT